MVILERKNIKTGQKSYLHKPAQWAYDVNKAAKFKTQKHLQNYMDSNYLMFNNKLFKYEIKNAE